MKATESSAFALRTCLRHWIATESQGNAFEVAQRMRELARDSTRAC